MKINKNFAIMMKVAITLDNTIMGIIHVFTLEIRQHQTGR